jgi:hypothetical protein
MNHQGWSTVTIDSDASGDINWDIEFVEDDNYKYLTRDPGSVTVEATGLNSVKISWRAQYYLNSGYQVYLNDELMGYAPATYFTIDGLDPAEIYTADVRTVWMDGDINSRPDGGDQEYGTQFSIGSLLPSEVSLTEIAGESNSYTINRPVAVGGVSYDDNISVAAGREAGIELSGIFKTFSARVGISDFNGPREAEGVKGRFRILGDGIVLYTSPVMSPGDMPRSVTINISGVDKLTLECVDVSGMSQGRRSPSGVWINPVVAK